MSSLPPLPDLHRHLDGSLRRSTLEALAAALPSPPTIPEDLAFEPHMGLDAALALFRITLAVLQTPDAVRRVAAEICEDAAAEGVTTLEIRFAPQLHGGAPAEEIVDAALDGVAGRAGLVLCALYGEDPAVPDRHVTIAADRPGVVGIDLAGGPDPGHAHPLEAYAPAYRRARDLGIGRTVHAGEGRPPEEIRRAVEVLHAQRIGHGTSLLEDPELADLLVGRGVTIEACPTSNWHTGAIERIEDHPLPRWLARGVAACVNPDNTLFSRTDAAEEHRRAAALPGMTEELLRQAVGHGHRAAFRR